MTTIGIFEAKTKLSELCERVAASGESVTITKRGRALVVLQPAAAPLPSIGERLDDYRARHREVLDDDEFELPARPREFRSFALNE